MFLFSGSLTNEVMLTLHDPETVQEDVGTSSEALLSYFALLGKSGNKDDIDLNFLDVLTIHGGNLLFLSVGLCMHVCMYVFMCVCVR